MGQVLEENTTIESLKEPLLVKTALAGEDKNSLAEDGVANNGNSESNKATEGESSSDHNGGIGAAVVEPIVSMRTCCAIGQWIWLYVGWTIAQDDFVFSIMAWTVIMVGHCYFLDMLSILPDSERKECRRQAEMNIETLPTILSGLRLFCLGTYEMAEKFLAIIGVSFFLFELSALLQKHNVLFIDFFEQNQQGNDRADHLEAQNQTENEIDSPDSNILKCPERRDCAVISLDLVLICMGNSSISAFG